MSEPKESTITIIITIIITITTMGIREDSIHPNTSQGNTSRKEDEIKKKKEIMHPQQPTAKQPTANKEYS